MQLSPSLVCARLSANRHLPPTIGRPQANHLSPEIDHLGCGSTVDTSGIYSSFGPLAARYATTCPLGLALHLFASPPGLLTLPAALPSPSQAAQASLHAHVALHGLQPVERRLPNADRHLPAAVEANHIPAFPTIRPRPVAWDCNSGPRSRGETGMDMQQGFHPHRRADPTPDLFFSQCEIHPTRRPGRP